MLQLEYMRSENGKININQQGDSSQRHGANIQKSILKTLAYFDIFDFPLAEEEIFKYLWSINNQQLTINNDLKDFVKQNRISQKENFYFLPGRDEIVEIRKNRYKISFKKIKKARRVVWWLRFIPWIKAIFICSGLGLLNAEEEADIDLLIITENNKIWSARWWSVGFLKILGMRPKNNHNQDKFCLSYFVVEDSLSLENTKIREDDTHLIYLLSYYLPLYFEDNLWPRFVEANRWIKKYLPNFSYSKKDIYVFENNQNERAQQDGSSQETGANIAKANFLIKPRLVWLKKLIRKSQFNWEEKLYKKIQLKIMPEILKKMMNKQGNKVIVNDKMLKLHTNDSRKEVCNKWVQKYNEIVK